MGRAQVSHGERKKWDLASTWDVGLTSENKTEEMVKSNKPKHVRTLNKTGPKPQIT